MKKGRDGNRPLIFSNKQDVIDLIVDSRLGLLEF